MYKFGKFVNSNMPIKCWITFAPICLCTYVRSRLTSCSLMLDVLHFSATIIDPPV